MVVRDGDELNCIFVQSWQTIAEATFISAIQNRIISYIGNKMLLAQVQDSVVGGYYMTRDEVKMDNVILARILSDCSVSYNLNKYLEQDGISGKLALSTILPELSY